jgi:hypothetical protein
VREGETIVKLGKELDSLRVSDDVLLVTIARCLNVIGCLWRERHVLARATRHER